MSDRGHFGIFMGKDGVEYGICGGYKKPKDPWSKQYQGETGWEKYSKVVRKLTERQDLSTIQNIERRGYDWNLDHIVPIKQGFLRKISPKKIAHRNNLQILSKRLNSIKHNSLTTVGKIKLQEMLDT